MRNSVDIAFLMFKYFTGTTWKSKGLKWCMSTSNSIKYCDASGVVFNTLTFDATKDTATLSIKNSSDIIIPINDVVKKIKEIGMLNDWQPTYLKYEPHELEWLTKNTKPYYDEIEYTKKF